VSGTTVPRDLAGSWPVLSSSQRARGAFVTLRTDEVRMPDGQTAARDVLDHPGAVAVVALDEAGRVLLIRQYRHPAGWLLWEIPAGLRDVAGEPPRVTAERELREEAGCTASRWHRLADYFTSPGITNERLLIYLARDVTELAAAERDYQPEHEEAHLITAWVPLEQVVDGFLSGELHNGVTAVGILAAYAAQQGGFAALREA
jgi:8-oxo-dGTP pyrophosphatase MutT (NUDIX family)